MSYQIHTIASSCLRIFTPLAGRFIIAALVTFGFAVGISGQARADSIQYLVDRSIGASASVSGTITIKDTGPVVPLDIEAFDLTLVVGSITVNITGPPTVLGSGSAFSATPTLLTFDFSLGGGDFVQFKDTASTTFYTLALGLSGFETVFVDDGLTTDFGTSLHSGLQVIGTVVPEPTTMVLLGSGLVGLVAWRMRKGRA